MSKWIDRIEARSARRARAAVRSLGAIKPAVGADHLRVGIGGGESAGGRAGAVGAARGSLKTPPFGGRVGHSDHPVLFLTRRVGLAVGKGDGDAATVDIGFSRTV